MKNCLDEKTLLSIHAREGSDAARAHLEGCLSCARRFRQLDDDLKEIVTVLKQPPPPGNIANPRRLPNLRWSLAAAVAGLAFLAGGVTTAMLESGGGVVAARQASTQVASTDRIEGIGGAAGYGLYVNDLLKDDEGDQVLPSAEEAPQRDLDEF